MIDKLLRRAAGTAAAADLPCGGRRPELLGSQVRSCPFGEDGDDLLIFLKGGGRIEKLQTEAAGKGQLFLYRIGAVDVTVMLYIAVVAPHLPHQMAAVGGGADSHVFRRGLRAALHDRLQIFIGGLVFLKGEIVQKQEKAVIAALDLPQKRRNKVILLLINLNKPQTLRRVLIGNSLNAGGLAGSGIAVE